MTIAVPHPGLLVEAVGQSATGDWLLVDQDRIQDFADATGDNQWIHVDAERASAGPFGATIAHGYLTLSLLPHLAGGLLSVEGVAMAINYGLNRLRFLQPVRVDSRIRARIEVLTAEEGAQGWRVETRTTVEVEGSEQPALVAENITLYVAA